ncbi:hypothetical protein PUMCH_002108 [Australozyma saopauloensis]|uniref:Formamidopyrimidine-DNA glycosylase catalytic domain-containing protein n=1 Tax=Australozyma saopauloensis TaxID=291208 RepID=A0AAX4H8J6_9ASCO|nr:hypothetical protein PUMCH_002108 [[Candida] saopauloensis]
MPEVAEVAHVCAQLRRHLVGRTITDAILPRDNLLFPQLTKEEPIAKSTDAFRDLIVGRKVEKACRHGKYFWLRLSPLKKQPVIIMMHLGMTGMIKLKEIKSHLILMENGGDVKVKKLMSDDRDKHVIVKRRKLRAFANSSDDTILVAQSLEGRTLTGVKVSQDTVLRPKDKTRRNVKVEDILLVDVKQEQTPLDELADDANEEDIDDVWPPKFTKFELVFSSHDKEKPIYAAFTDPRRLGRVRFYNDVDCMTEESLMKRFPLDKLGPDYSKAPDGSEASKFVFGDPDPSPHGRPRLDFEQFSKLILSRKKVAKTLLLDQGIFAGIGNWVADEVLFQARIHPNEILLKSIDTEDHEVVKRLYDAIIYVMEFAVNVEGDAKKFPEDWLMLHRWGKRRKEADPQTKTGHSLEFVTLGGRTSCFVPKLQKLLNDS